MSDVEEDWDSAKDETEIGVGPRWAFGTVGLDKGNWRDKGKFPVRADQVRTDRERGGACAASERSWREWRLKRALRKEEGDLDLDLSGSADRLLWAWTRLLSRSGVVSRLGVDLSVVEALRVLMRRSREWMARA